MMELIHFSFPAPPALKKGTAGGITAGMAGGTAGGITAGMAGGTAGGITANAASGQTSTLTAAQANCCQGLQRVHCVFQTRQGGFSKHPFNEGNIAYTVNDDPAAVLANRKALLAQLGINAWAEENQVHGDDMVLDAQATALESKGQHNADGLTSSETGLGLMIKTADCQPILIAHQSGKYIAALHVGWRGNRINFIGKAIKQFCAHYQIEPAHLLAVRGPSLSPSKAQFTNFEAEWGESFLPWFDQENKTMDLWQLTRHQLTKAGLPEANIHGINLCTYTAPDLFFSYRRNKNLSGRQASFIWIE